jgi:NDP-sugar pyrophosphorylase family protein
LRERRLRHVPLVDAEGRPGDLAWIDEIVGLAPNMTPVVLMAGGLGLHLRRLTGILPKLMLTVGDTPLLEIILRNVIDQEFVRFTRSVSYLADVIGSRFGCGHSFGVEIDQTERKGKAGALSQMPDWPDTPFVVMNADPQTTPRFELMLRFHTDTNAAATMGHA